MKNIKAKITKYLNKVTLGTYKVGVCYRSLLVFTYSIFVFSVFSNHAHAADIFDSVQNLVEDARDKIVMLSTAAAGIGVGSGVFMKKFSMGKQDKIELGNKVIKDSLIGWFTINALTSILGYLGNFVD